MEVPGRYKAVPLHDGTTFLLADAIAQIFRPEDSSITRMFGRTCKGAEEGRATVLTDGTVLLTGGKGDQTCAELFNPETQEFSSLEEMKSAHERHMAILLKDGRVLVAGGIEGVVGEQISHTKAEIFDPVTSSFSITGDLNLDRAALSGALLPSGKVIVIGGASVSPGIFTSRCNSEYYDPDTGTFTANSESSGCSESRLTWLGDELLITAESGKAHIYNPADDSFRRVGDMLSTWRKWHAATLLPSGEVLITGGRNSLESKLELATTEIFDPNTESFTAGEDMTRARFRHATFLNGDGHVLALGGQDQITMELFLPSNR